jgi:hypothetical protein
MNVNDAYMFNVMNINFVLIYINNMPIYGSISYTRKSSNSLLPQIPQYLAV